MGSIIVIVMDPTQSQGYHRIELPQDARVPLQIAAQKVLTEGLKLPVEEGMIMYPPHMIAKVVVDNGRKRQS